MVINLSIITDPVRDELFEVEKALKNIENDLSGSVGKDVFNHFFKSHGKYLRPALILLSANAANPNTAGRDKARIIQLAVAVELIHSASLIHDDIIDGDLLRRGQKTLDNMYGRKIAVLAGDTLYAKAFSILSNDLPRESEQVLTRVIEKMCLAEIDQAKAGEVTLHRYFGLIEGKTALLMGACCRLGAFLAKAGEDDIKALEEYGVNFGMVYQIIDDCTDNDQDTSNNATMDNARHFAGKAMLSLEALKPTPYRQGLAGLLNYVFGILKPVARKDVQ